MKHHENILRFFGAAARLWVKSVDTTNEEAVHAAAESFVSVARTIFYVVVIKANKGERA